MMERLTNHEMDNYNELGCDLCSAYCYEMCNADDAVRDCAKRLRNIRLAAYDDTGLTPEEVAELARANTIMDKLIDTFICGECENARCACGEDVENCINNSVKAIDIDSHIIRYYSGGYHCPHCNQLVEWEQRVCKYCDTELANNYEDAEKLVAAQAALEAQEEQSK